MSGLDQSSSCYMHVVNWNSTFEGAGLGLDGEIAPVMVEKDLSLIATLAFFKQGEVPMAPFISVQLHSTS